MATLLSIQVGLPAQHGPDSISDKPWQSGIFKAPVDGPIWLDTLNLAGDGQDDLKHHGGMYRAVLAYAADHYPIWREELARPDLPFGAFGENFTVSELTEDTVYLGDVYAVGEARLQVAQPRQPCWKLARRVGIADLAARVEAKGWGGWYHHVVQTGYVQAGDSVQLLRRGNTDYSIARLNRLMKGREVNREAMAELAEMETLSTDWRKAYRYLLSRDQ